jgi:hypothetical protein
VEYLIKIIQRYSKWVTGFLLFYLACFVTSTTITQDDYATLSDLVREGFWGPINGVWNVLGGNISSVLPRTLALGFGFSSGLHLGLIAYSAVTLILICLSFDYLLRLFIPGLKESAFRLRLPLILVSSLGFEGLFSPGELGVLGFSAAAGVHVWPICLIIIGYWLYSQKSLLAAFGTTLAFLYASNSNVPEGVFALIVVIFLSYRAFLSHSYKPFNKTFNKNLVLLVTTIAGLATIFIAPGFQSRSEAAGVSLELKDLVTGVARSGIFFTADILSHPFIYLMVVIGFVLARKTNLRVAKQPIKEFGVFAVLYFLLLVAGAGVAYPAWHQTFGLYIFLLPLAFSFGVLCYERKPNLNLFGRVLLIPVLIICLLITVRSGFTVFNRKMVWQSNFEHNICLIRSGSNQGFRGSEITYPPKNLGIEDINTWTWMADDFTSWVFETDFSCKK